VCSHNGGTGGFSASIGLRPDSRRAVGGLVNTSFRSAPILDSAVLAALTDGAVGRQPEGRARTNAEQLATLWGSPMRWAGAPVSVSAASCRTVPGGIGALVSIGGARRARCRCC